MIWLVAGAFAEEPQLSAEDLQRARVLYEQGEALYSEARWDEAAAAFRLSYALSKKPLLLYNMASCYERMGEWEDALESLEAYRPSASADEAETIDRRLAALRLKVEEIEAKDRALAEAQQRAAQPAPAPAPVANRGPAPLPIALLSAGALAVGTGTFFTVRTLDARADWRALCTDADPLLCPAAADPLVRRDRTSGVVADLSWILSAGLLTTGLVVAF